MSCKVQNGKKELQAWLSFKADFVTGHSSIHLEGMLA